MASTNKTTHYELSQYVGSDKPTYLTDYNTDMSNIDTGIYNAQSKGDSAYTLASGADTKADTALSNAGTALTNAGTANTNIGTMANLTTSEKSSLVGAINEVDGNVDTLNSKFNFTTFTSYGTSDVTNNSNGTLSECSLTLATNSDNSVLKLYGNIVVNNATANGTITIPATRLRPDSEITVNPLGVRFGYATSQGLSQVYSAGATFKTNGDIVINFIANSSYWSSRTILFPCVIFLKDFGDTPSN